jgi:hypothetical protein
MPARLNLAPPRSVMIRLFFGNGLVVAGFHGAFTLRLRDSDGLATGESA